MTTQHPNPAQRWKHRRRMAYFAACTLCAFTLGLPCLALFSPAAIKALGAVSAALGSALLALGGIVGAYTGFASLEKKET